MPRVERYGCSVLLCSALCLTSACGQEHPEPPSPLGPVKVATEPEVARLAGFQLRSQPPNTSVFVDGKLRGTTPLRVNDLQPGDHRIRLEAQGYEPQEAAPKLEAGTMVELPELVLQPIRANSAREQSMPPPWRANGTLPRDFEATSQLEVRAGAEWLEIIARGARLEVEWKRRTWGAQTSCVRASTPRRLALFGWPELERMFLSRVGRNDAPDESLPVRRAFLPDGRILPLTATLTAHGYAAASPEIDHLHLANEVHRRLMKLIEPDLLASRPLHDAFANVIPAIGACGEQMRTMLHVNVVVSKSSARVRVEQIATRLYGSPIEILPSELACVRGVLQQLVPPPPTCEVQVELTAYGPQPELPPGVVE
jgi:hypothetical protein